MAKWKGILGMVVCLIFMFLSIYGTVTILGFLKRGSLINGVVIFAGIIFSAAFGYGVAGFRRASDSSGVPELTTSVKVVAKATNITGRYATTSYFISFEFPDGTRKNFAVNINQYNTITENDIGILTYKEKGDKIWFVNFQRTK